MATNLHYGTLAADLKTLWPGVSPDPVCTVLTDVSKTDPDVGALVEQALGLPGPRAATALMCPVAATLAQRESADRPVVLHALDALIRAGGDPSDALSVAAEALGRWRTAAGAADMLCRAALRGWSLAGVYEAIEACPPKASPEKITRLQRLSELQKRGDTAALRLLAEVYQAQPVSNLRGGIGVLESALLSERVDVARDALVGLQAAGSELFGCWLALVPVLDQQLRDGRPAVQREAARAVAQIRYVLTKTSRSAQETPEMLKPRARLLLDALMVPLLSGDGPAASAAAAAVRTLVDHGGSLEHVRGAVERALDDSRVDVRSGCSRALSTWLLREGEEEGLPAGCSHRRVFAATDEPLDEGQIGCMACGESAAILYRWNDGAQFYSRSLTEARCASCGCYSEQHWQSPG